ncbi:MAG: MinD/ParA family protein [Halothiobacillaceae bacterium]|nr:MinD/ParA family protein [Halothiobacillaceae bacterium]
MHGDSQVSMSSAERGMTDDQAAGLRRMVTPRPVQVIAVTSGKGGVGKTNVSVNLAMALARMGRKVLLMDADLGLGNVDVQLGLSPKYNLSHVIDGSRSLEEVIVEGPLGVYVIPAASGVKKMAELTPGENAGLIHAFGHLSLAIDTMIVDTAAGIAESVVSFARAAREVVVVVCDEPASITDAYAMIKVLSREYGVQRFHVIANMTHHPQEGRKLYGKLLAVTDRFLDVTLGFLGAVPYDEYLRKAIQRQQPVVVAYGGSRSAQAFSEMATRVAKWPRPRTVEGHLEFFMERLVQYASTREPVT